MKQCPYYKSDILFHHKYGIVFKCYTIKDVSCNKPIKQSLRCANIVLHQAMAAFRNELFDLVCTPIKWVLKLFGKIWRVE